MTILKVMVCKRLNGHLQLRYKCDYLDVGVFFFLIMRISYSKQTYLPPVITLS